MMKYMLDYQMDRHGNFLRYGLFWLILENLQHFIAGTQNTHHFALTTLSYLLIGFLFEKKKKTKTKRL